jgi:2,3-dimethylmalate lyase
MKFRELVASERPLVLPGAHDAISARLIKLAGFKAFFIGGLPLLGAR